MTWPNTDDFEQMTDEQLREHAAEIKREGERCSRGIVPTHTDLDAARAGYACDLRLEHIRDVLRARARNQAAT